MLNKKTHQTGGHGTYLQINHTITNQRTETRKHGQQDKLPATMNRTAYKGAGL